MKRSEMKGGYKTPLVLDYTKLKLISQSVLALSSGDLDITWRFQCGSYTHSRQFFVTANEIQNSRSWVQYYSEGLIV